MVINFTFKYANLCAYRAYNHTYLILKSIKLVELPADWVKRFAIHFNFNRERRDDFLELPKINEWFGIQKRETHTIMLKSQFKLAKKALLKQFLP